MANGKKNDEIPSVAALLRNDDVPLGWMGGGGK